MKMPEILRIAIQQLLHRGAEQRVRREPSRRFSALKTVMVTPALRRFTAAGIIGITIVALMSPTQIARLAYIDVAVFILTLLVLYLVIRGVFSLPEEARGDPEQR